MRKIQPHSFISYEKTLYLYPLLKYVFENDFYLDSLPQFNCSMVAILLYSLKKMSNQQRNEEDYVVFVFDMLYLNYMAYT